MRTAERHFTAARDLIRASGARLTLPRTAVLAALLGHPQAMSHQDVFDALPASYAIDRVTIYRVLEWLVGSGHAHRIAGDDRIWRYTTSAPHERGGGHDHAHFACSDCGRVECLPGVRSQRAMRLPEGYVSREVEMTVKGYCAACAVHH
jgi:Fur family ferric uptake transcriptional regulator